MDRAQASEAWDRGPIPRGDTKCYNEKEGEEKFLILKSKIIIIIN